MAVLLDQVMYVCALGFFAMAVTFRLRHSVISRHGGYDWICIHCRSGGFGAWTYSWDEAEERYHLELLSAPLINKSCWSVELTCHLVSRLYETRYQRFEDTIKLLNHILLDSDDRRLLLPDLVDIVLDYLLLAPEATYHGFESFAGMLLYFNEY